MNIFKNKILWGIIIPLIIICGAFVVYRVYATKLAHTTFERYYTFRGCIRLIDKTDTYGDCMTASNRAIKIVLIGDRWYLDGDGPNIW